MLAEPNDDKGGLMCATVMAGITLLNGSRFKQLKRDIGILTQGKNIMFVSTGNWSLHQLVEYVLLQTGKASIYITTWSITEEPARNILRLKKEGYIETVSCILDYRAKQRSNKSTSFIVKNFDKVVFAKCHAKTVLIENEHWRVVITGSANFTRNPRIETGFVLCDEVSFTFSKKWIMNVMNNGHYKMLKDGFE